MGKRGNQKFRSIVVELRSIDGTNNFAARPDNTRQVSKLPAPPISKGHNHTSRTIYDTNSARSKGNVLSGLKSASRVAF